MIFEGIPMEDIKRIVGDVVSSPTIFGPIFWSYAEILALTDEEGFWEMMSRWRVKLPCHKCREHLQNNYPISITPFEYIVELHNLVNKSQGREEKTVTQRLEELYRMSV